MNVKVVLMIFLCTETSLQALLKFGNIPFVTIGAQKKKVEPFKDSIKPYVHHTQ